MVGSACAQVFIASASSNPHNRTSALKRILVVFDDELEVTAPAAMSAVFYKYAGRIKIAVTA